LTRTVRRRQVVVVRSHDISNEHINPVIPVAIALSTEDMSRTAARRRLLRLDDEERVTIFFLVVRFSSVTRPLLTADLCSSNSDRTQMGPASLWMLLSMYRIMQIQKHSRFHSTPTLAPATRNTASSNHQSSSPASSNNLPCILPGIQVSWSLEQYPSRRTR